MKKRARESDLSAIGREAAAGLGRWLAAALRAAASEDGARALLSVLVVAAIAVASRRARLEVLAREDLAIDPDALAVELPPALSERARADVARLHLGRVSPHEPRLVPFLARELGALPWVDRVETVRVDFPPKVVFRVRALVPLARIRERGDEWLVARDGRPVPLDAVASPAASFPRVDGLPSELSLERARALDAGLAVIESLRARGLVERLPLVAVDVSNWDGKKDARASELVLDTGSSARIEWGRPAGAPRAPTNDERIQKLETWLARGARLDQVARVSLRWGDPVIVPREAAPPLALPSGLSKTTRG